MESMITYLVNFVKPELLIMIPVCYLLGIGFKRSEVVKDNLIPIMLGVISVFLCTIYVISTSDLDGYKSVMMAVFISITQGILTSGCSVYINQLIKQSTKEE